MTSVNTSETAPVPEELLNDFYKLNKKPVHKNFPQRFSYAIGKFFKHTIDAMSDEEIGHLKPAEVRKTGYKTLMWLTLGCTALGVVGPRVIPSDKVPFVPQPEQACDFTQGTTVVTRHSSESDPQLGVIHTKGVNYGHGQFETEAWIKTHNTGLHEWPGEQVTIPVAYECHPK